MKVKAAVVLMGLVVLLAAGCAAPASKINSVSIGMTKDQVLKIMGPPASITADTNAVYLNYALSEQLGEGHGTPYEIKLVDGKVVSYGRAGALNSPRSAPVPIIVPQAR